MKNDKPPFRGGIFQETVTGTEYYNQYTYDRDGKLISANRYPQEVTRIKARGRLKPTRPGYVFYPSFRNMSDRASGHVVLHDAEGSRTEYLPNGRTRVTIGRLPPMSGLLDSIPWVANNLAAVVVPYNMIARADTEALTKIADKSLDIAVSVAQGKETLLLIATQFKRVMQAYQALKAGNIVRALRFLAVGRNFRFKSKDFAGRWLELQFGWLPLLSDVKAGYDLFTGQVTKKQLWPVRAVRQISNDVENTQKSGGWVYNSNGRLSCKTVLWFTVESPWLAWASSLGLTNPATVLWEVVPYSFVVDWFFPVGNLLEAATATLGVRFLSGCHTFYCEGEGYGAYTFSAGALTGETASYSWKAYNRVRLTSFPIAKPYVKSPFSSTHIADCLALLRQLKP